MANIFNWTGGIKIYHVFAKKMDQPATHEMRLQDRFIMKYIHIYIYSFIIHLIQFPGEGAIRAELWIKVKRRA